jgi:hypothetical protein
MQVEPISASYGISPTGGIAAREERLGLRHRDIFDALRRAALYSLVAYLPFLLAASFERMRVGHWDAAMTTFDTHVRTLVAQPILLIAEHVVDVSARAVSTYLVRAGIVQGGALARYRSIAGEVAALRDSTLAATVLFAIALGTATLHLDPLEGMTRPVFGAGTIIMLTLFRFVLLRWLWGWALWTVFLARVSRLPLTLTATHPDRMGGLGVLLGPSQAFALVAAGGGAAIASSWANRIVYGHASTADFQADAIMYFAMMLLTAAAPLWFFSGALYRVRKQGLVHYGAFAQQFGAAFELWTRHHQFGPTSTDSPEISSMTDLGGTYERVASMKSVLWSRRLVLNMVVACGAPVLPLMLAEKQVPELLLDLLKALV